MIYYIIYICACVFVCCFQSLWLFYFKIFQQCHVGSHMIWYSSIFITIHVGMIQENVHFGPASLEFTRIPGFWSTMTIPRTYKHGRANTHNHTITRTTMVVIVILNPSVFKYISQFKVRFAGQFLSPVLGVTWEKIFQRREEKHGEKRRGWCSCFFCCFSF